MLAAIEKELIAEVQNSPLFANLKEVKSLPDVDSQTMISMFKTRAPAVYFAMMPAKIEGDKIILTWSAALVARHAGDQEIARHGSKASVGLFPLMTAFLSLFYQGRTNSASWQCKSARTVPSSAFIKAGLQVGLVQIQAPVCIPDKVDESSLNDFEHYHADHDLDLADGNIDATDDVTDLQS